MPKKQSGQLADVLFPEPELEVYEESILSIPPEQRRLHTETYDFSISTIIRYLKDGSLYVPEFQRRYVWTDSQASRLVESLIIQCPIPVIYLNQERDERLSVIDGNQRLTSLSRYVDGDFALKGLTAYPELEGLSFEQLDPRFQRHIMNRTLRCIVIAKDTHPQVKFDVFERLNTGSVKLTPQELRHGLYYGPLMQHVERLNKNAEWKRLISIAGERRMRGEELIVRFLAMHFHLPKYRKPLASFLNDFAEEYRNAEQAQLDAMTEVFDGAVDTVLEVYGDVAFRVYDKEQQTVGPFNAALFDAEMLSVSTYTELKRPVSEKRRKAFLRELGELFQDETFLKMITRATSDDRQVSRRIAIVSEIARKHL